MDSNRTAATQLEWFILLGVAESMLMSWPFSTEVLLGIEGKRAAGWCNRSPSSAQNSWRRGPSIPSAYFILRGGESIIYSLNV